MVRVLFLIGEVREPRLSAEIALVLLTDLTVVHPHLPDEQELFGAVETVEGHVLAGVGVLDHHLVPLGTLDVLLLDNGCGEVGDSVLVLEVPDVILAEGAL